MKDGMKQRMVLKGPVMVVRVICSHLETSCLFKYEPYVECDNKCESEVLVYAMKAFSGKRDMAPLILNLRT